MKNIRENIKDILLNYKVGTQEEIAALLEKKGLHATQSNISRALKKIGVVKQIDDQGNSIYKIPLSQLTGTQFLSQLIFSIEDNGYVIIINTHPGAAGTVGQLIDERSMEMILGTIAGDNTLLIIPKSIKSIKKLKKQLTELLHKGGKS